METANTWGLSGTIAEAAKVGQQRKSFFSFGDEGVTATVGASGRLLRMSRHFAGTRTGFCVDDGYALEPWWVQQRLETFLEWAEDPLSKRGIGPVINEVSDPVKVVNHRWPTFEGKSEDGTAYTLQYGASDGIIYQRFQFAEYDAIHSNSGNTKSPLQSRMDITPDWSIHSLDFVNRPEIDKLSSEEPNYESGSLANTLIRRKIKGAETPVLSIHALDEDSCLEFVPVIEAEELGDDSSSCCTYSIQPKAVSKLQPRVFILAYVLEHFSEEATGCSAAPTWKMASQKMDDFMVPLEEHSLTEDLNPNLDFYLSRNLEYMLSVCSIPIPDYAHEEFPCFALTCGDIESHRVATAASFHIFQTLMLALEYFEHRHKNCETCDCNSNSSHTTKRPYICMMARRIYRVCSGHIKWLFQKANHSGGLFCSNYWPNGEEIASRRSADSLPRKSHVDAPFQIMKACRFFELRGKDRFPCSSARLKEAIEAWVKDLDQMNKLGRDVFPRYDDDMICSFYLTDNALIWQGIKSAEAIGLAPEFGGLASTQPYRSKNLQTKIVEKFATQNPQSKAPMFAVTRSLAGNRFLLRSRDTALFTAMDSGLFDEVKHAKGKIGASKTSQNGMELWTNTVDSQKDHEQNDDITWCDPQRFILAIIMAQKQKTINSRPAQKMYEHALSVLLKGSSVNGLFPGWLNESGEPVAYESNGQRDTYWAVTFEIPHILWKSHRPPTYTTICEPTGKPFATPKVHGISRGRVETPPKSDLNLILDELKQLSRSSADICSLLRGDSGRLTASTNSKQHLRPLAEHFQPLNYTVDEDNIVELDDEWLYNEPTFFVPQSTMCHETEDIEDLSMGILIDVPRSRDLKNETREGYFLGHFSSVGQIQQIARGGRNVEEAKKRLWVFFSGIPRDNKGCTSTVLDEENGGIEMQSFFARHESFVRFFAEETSAALNTWTTEVHLSFYRLGTSNHPEKRISRLAELGFTEAAPGILVSGKGEQRKHLAKVAMSFRIEGDLFDRYWTCHFLEADSQEMDSRKANVIDARGEDVLRQMREIFLVYLAMHCKTEMKRFFSDGYINKLRKNSWQQRRVLELMLFGRILQRMNDGAKEILHESWLSLCDNISEDQKDQTVSEEPEYDMFLITTDDVVISRKRVEQIQRVLRALMGNLEENIAQIALWQNRERDRQAEKPRWTFNDENRYRITIQKLLVSNNHEVLRLRHYLLKISKLEESLAKKLEMIRSDLDEQRGGETQLFTYVTVVFLPLGFATGIFSMSEAPTSQTLHSMIFLASMAFVVVALLGVVLRIMMSTVVKRCAVPYWLQIKATTREQWDMAMEACGINKLIAGNYRTRMAERWRVCKIELELASVNFMVLLIRCRHKMRQLLLPCLFEIWAWTMRLRGKRRWDDVEVEGEDTELGMTKSVGAAKGEPGMLSTVEGRAEGRAEDGIDGRPEHT